MEDQPGHSGRDTDGLREGAVRGARVVRPRSGPDAQGGDGRIRDVRRHDDGGRSLQYDERLCDGRTRAGRERRNGMIRVAASTPQLMDRRSLTWTSIFLFHRGTMRTEMTTGFWFWRRGRSRPSVGCFSDSASSDSDYISNLSVCVLQIVGIFKRERLISCSRIYLP